VRRSAASESISRCCGPNTEPDPVPGANIVSNTGIITTSGLEMLSVSKDSDSFALCREHYVKTLSESPYSTNHKRRPSRAFATSV
jgi:hypothetical protein